MQMDKCQLMGCELGDRWNPSSLPDQRCCSIVPDDSRPARVDGRAAIVIQHKKPTPFMDINSFSSLSTFAHQTTSIAPVFLSLLCL